MVFIEGIKYACERCIRGHRVTGCKHTNLPLIAIRPKGRPSSICEHCKDVRQRKKTSQGCSCSGPNHDPLCPCSFKQQLCTCKPSKRSSTSSVPSKRQPVKSRRTPNNKPKSGPSSATDSSTESSSNTESSLDPNSASEKPSADCKDGTLTNQPSNPASDNTSFSQLPEIQKLPSTVVTPLTNALSSPSSASSSRSNSVDEPSLITAHSSPAQSPLSTSTPSIASQNQSTPTMDPVPTNDVSVKLPSISLTPSSELPSHQLHDRENQRVTLPMPKRLSIAYSSTSDQLLPSSSSSTNSHTTLNFHNVQDNYKQIPLISSFGTTDYFALPSLTLPPNHRHSSDALLSRKFLSPTAYSALVSSETLTDRVDHNYRRASIGALPSSSYLPSISSITYTVSSTRTQLTPNALGRRISVGGESKHRTNIPSLEKNHLTTRLFNTETKPCNRKKAASYTNPVNAKTDIGTSMNVLKNTKDSKTGNQTGLYLTKDNDIIYPNQDKSNYFRITGTGKVSKNTRTSIQNLIHSTATSG